MTSENYNDIIAELRHEYLHSFSEKFESLRGFFSTKDWYAIELEFHKLKGTGATYGAPEVTILCEQLERICRDNGKISVENLEKAIGLLAHIRDKYLNNKAFELVDHQDFVELKNL